MTQSMDCSVLHYTHTDVQEPSFSSLEDGRMRLNRVVDGSEDWEMAEGPLTKDRSLRQVLVFRQKCLPL